MERHIITYSWVVGFHRYPDAPEYCGYLSCRHRYVFAIKTGASRVKVLEDEMMSKALPDCLGMAIKLTGTHMCKRMRGVRAGGKMTNYVFTGVFEKNENLKAKFIRHD